MLTNIWYSDQGSCPNVLGNCNWPHCQVTPDQTVESLNLYLKDLLDFQQMDNLRCNSHLRTRSHIALCCKVSTNNFRRMQNFTSPDSSHPDSCCRSHLVERFCSCSSSWPAWKGRVLWPYPRTHFPFPSCRQGPLSTHSTDQTLKFTMKSHLPWHCLNDHQHTHKLQC